MIEIIPGDPASFMLGINAEPETVDALRKELGLDISTFERYFNWISYNKSNLFYLHDGRIYENNKNKLIYNFRYNSRSIFLFYIS